MHMLGDLLGAAAIVAGALIIRATGWTRIDPILSVAISLLVVWTAWDIIRESLNILLEGLPRGRGSAGSDEGDSAAWKACWMCTICISGVSVRIQAR